MVIVISLILLWLISILLSFRILKNVFSAGGSKELTFSDYFEMVFVSVFFGGLIVYLYYIYDLFK